MAATNLTLDAGSGATDPTTQRLFNIANSVALKYCTKLGWSNWPAWNFYDQNPALSNATLSEAYARMLGDCPKLSTCFTMAHITSQAFRHELLHTAGLEAYADKVKLLVGYQRRGETSRESIKAYVECAEWTPEDVASAAGSHGLCALELDGLVIVIDVAQHPTAFMVGVDGSYEAVPALGFGGVELNMHTTGTWTCMAMGASQNWSCFITKRRR
jgi:hypothetical protein